MRYLFGFICVCALGAMPLVGCGEAPECQMDEDCDDQDECSLDFCSDGSCVSVRHGAAAPLNGNPCERAGLVGVCVDGSCWREEPECRRDWDCDNDQNACTYESCEYSCYYECSLHSRLCKAEDTSFTECGPCDRSGAPGVCMDGVCEEAECLTDVDCDDDIACTDDSCDCGGCRNDVNCFDDNRCTEDRCDRDSGMCSYPVLPDGTGCGCLRWDTSCEDWICQIFWCPPCECRHDGHCESGECV